MVLLLTTMTLYVSWVLSALVQGAVVSEGSLRNLLEFRKEICRLMQDALRHQAIGDETGPDPDVCLIGIAAVWPCRRPRANCP